MTITDEMEMHSLSESRNTLASNSSPSKIAVVSASSRRKGEAAPAARNVPLSAHPPGSRQQSTERQIIKRIRVYRNGDANFAGLDYKVAYDRNRTLDGLLQDLNHVLNDKLYLNLGVRYVLTMDGVVVKSLSELKDNQSYVASSVEILKKIGYGSIKSKMLAICHEDALKRRSLAEPKSSRFESQIPQPETTQVTTSFTPRRVFVLLNGPKPRLLMRLLIDERSRRCGSLTKIMDEITNFFSPLPGPIRKLFDIELGECHDFNDLFHGDIFLASVSGKISRLDRKLDADEQKQVAKKKSLGRSVISARSGITHPGEMPVFSQRDFQSPQVSRRMTLPKQHGFDFSCFNINHPPEIRDRYNIGKLIGNGNFATVHECIEWRTGRQVAMKIIEKNKIRDKRLLGNEISILRSLRHPNIVNLLNEYSYAGRLYVVMELMRSGDLFSLISEATKIEETDAVELMRCLCWALDYLHTNRVVHRDVKPENLLITQSFDGSRTLKLADFGLAAEVKNGEPLFTICGSPTYVAPEILSESGYGFKVDVWAAGVTLYILLCGFPPFQNDENDQEALFSQILSGQFEYRSPYCDHVSPQARDLIRRMLNVEVEDRLFAHQVLEHEWTKIHSRLKPIRELSVAASSSSDSGITLTTNQQSTKQTSNKTTSCQVSDSRMVSDKPGKSTGKQGQWSYRRFASSSVADLPAELSPTFWANF